MNRASWTAGLLVCGGVIAGCGSSSSAGTETSRSTVRPAASATDALTGLGASKASWVAAHGRLDGGAFSAVKVGGSTGHPITGLQLSFAPVREGIGRFNAESQLPADVKTVASTLSATCLRVHYTSQLLARKSSVGPDLYAYLYSGTHGFPYNDQRVNRVVLTSSAGVAGC